MAGEDGPEIFFAHAWISWEVHTNVRIPARVPMSLVTRQFMNRDATRVPAAIPLDLERMGDDKAVADITSDRTTVLARAAHLNHSIYLVRMPTTDEEARSIGVIEVDATHGNGKSTYAARMVANFPSEALMEWATETFGTAAPAPR